MDGVLVDSEPIHGRAWRRVLAQWNLAPPPDWFHPWIGVADRKLAAHLAESGTVPADAATILQAKRSVYDAMSRVDLKPFTGVREGINTLRYRLRKLGHAPSECLAVCTSSVRTEALTSLTTTGLIGFFPRMVCGDEVSQIKPSPEPYLKAAELLGLVPGECIVLEDSRAGITAAMTAGCYTLAIASTHAASELPPSHQVFDSTAAAIAWLLQLE
jgi:HAD superfamily hydrolase (TIGR01509 family)